MTDAPTLSSLIATLEAAIEPSRELADEVLLAGGWKANLLEYYPTVWKNPDGDRSYWRPNPLESMDAAISLVPEGWYGQINFGEWPPYRQDNTTLWSNDSNCKENFFGVPGKALTPAHALTIAALKARLAMAEKEARDDG